MQIRELIGDDERRDAVPILQQLWSDAAPADVMAWTTADDYHLFGGFVANELVGVAGVLVGNHLHHARHAWLYRKYRPSASGLAPEGEGRALNRQPKG